MSLATPTLPPPPGGSTIGVGRLNGRVRDGNGCCPPAMVARDTYIILFFLHLSRVRHSSKIISMKLYCFLKNKLDQNRSHPVSSIRKREKGGDTGWSLKYQMNYTGYTR